MDKNRIKKIIREEIGRNYKTIVNEPFQFDDFVDYEMELVGNTMDQFSLTIYYKGKKVFPTTKFKDRDEANHIGRIFIDNHRKWAMNQDQNA